MLTDNTESYYAATGNKGRTAALQPAFVPIMDALDAKNFDFAPFDENKDLIIDLVVFMHSGYAGELGSTDCNTGATPYMRIASHATSEDQSTAWTSKSGYVLGSYVIVSAFRGACGANIARIGTICHEMIHPLGIPDLYDIQGPLNPTGSVGGLGNYDIMVSLDLLLRFARQTPLTDNDDLFLFRLNNYPVKSLWAKKYASLSRPSESLDKDPVGLGNSH